jgi:tRNA uridine 5-carbamoylmethylation protein Kti12
MTYIGTPDHTLILLLSLKRYQMANSNRKEKAFKAVNKKVQRILEEDLTDDEIIIAVMNAIAELRDVVSDTITEEDVRAWALDNDRMIISLHLRTKREKLIDFISKEIYPLQQDRDVFLIY